MDPACLPVLVWVHRPVARPASADTYEFAIEAGQLADSHDAQTVSFERIDLFHVFPPEQVSALLCFPESGLHQLFVGVGIFQPALWVFLHRR
jgi:hypothetical protein